MLVLSRKSNQEILINGNIRISILKIKGNVVRIGVDAPAEVSIKRGELEDKRTEPSPLVSASVDPAVAVNEVIETVVVNEEPAGYQLLPLPSSDTTTGDLSQETTDISSKFPEIFNRSSFCDIVPPKNHLA